MAYNNGPRIVTDGLVLHLDAANRDSYPGTGNTWYNLAPLSMNFTLQNSPAWDGKSLDFSTNEYADRSGSTLNFADDYTCISFSDILDTPSSWRTLIRGDYEHPVIIDTSNNLGWYSNLGGGFRSCGYNVETGGIESRWSMMTLLGENGSTNKFYVDGGNQVGSSTTNTAGNNCSGRGHYRICWPAQPWGKISTLLFYNRALSTDEMDINYKALKGRFGL